MIILGTLAVIRDIFIIVASGVFVLVLLVAGWLAFGLYRPLRRAARNLEGLSEIIVNRVVGPLSNLPSLAEVAKNVMGLVQQYRAGERRNDDDERE